MEACLGEYRIRYADGVVRSLPERLSLGWGSIGVFTLAVDIRGPELYLDVYERPDFAHRLLDIITDKVIGRYRWLSSMSGSDISESGRQNGTYLVDDSAGALSPHLYREYVYPRNMRVVGAVGRPLAIHIDSPANHLLPFYRDMQVESFPGFGWGTSLEKVRKYLGGQAVLTGNVSPSLLAQGTPDEVYHAAWRVLETLAPCGGLILSEGANMPPGTPLENMQAMLRAAEDYGLPVPQSA
jgi:uroporphyrinogen decarboxylase